MAFVSEIESTTHYDQNYSHLHEIVDRSQNWMSRIKDMQMLYGELVGPLELRRGSTLLDVGSGVGRPGHYLRHLGVRTFNVDINESAQQAATGLWGSNNKNNFQVVSDGSLSLPFKDNAVDAICSQDFFEHIDPLRLDGALEEMSRVLAGNRMVHRITVLQEPENLFADKTHRTFWSSEQWQSWFEERGWQTVAPTSRRTYAPRANVTGLSAYCHGYFLLERSD